MLLFRSHGARLPVILTKKDQKLLNNQRKKHFGRKPIWLGAKYSEGSFLWNTGTPVADGYQNWIRGQPDNCEKDEECMTTDSKGKWNGINCDWTSYVICEKCLPCHF